MGLLNKLNRSKILAVAGTLVVCLTACHGRQEIIEGFPHYDAEDLDKTARLVTATTATIVEAIEARKTARLNATEGDEAQKVLEESFAMQAIAAAHFTMGAEHIDYVDPAQSIPLPIPPPLQVYPRLTAPHIAEPKIVAENPADATAPRRKWFVPLILNKHALNYENSVAITWFGHGRTPQNYERPQELLSFWLQVHSSVSVDEREYLNIDKYLINPEALEVPVSKEFTYRLPDVKETYEAVAFALPVAQQPSSPDEHSIRPGFYDIVVVPKIQVEGMRAPCTTGIGESLTKGNWYELLHTRGRFDHIHTPEETAQMEEDYRVLADTIAAFPPTYYHRGGRIQKKFRDLSENLSKYTQEGMTCEETLFDLDQILRLALSQMPHPAPVLLDAPTLPDAPFSFVVAADFQFGGDITDLHRFMQMIDPSLSNNVNSTEDGFPLISDRFQQKLEACKFVLVAGDLADGAGNSSSPGWNALNGMGLAPPISPYTAGANAGEMPALRRELMKFGKPVFGVPGNHDGYANFGGLLNNGFHYLSRGFKILPWPFGILTHPIGEGLNRISRNLPILVKVSRFGDRPFYDGLVEYQYHLGPLNLAFQYRGHGFVGLNSYNLPLRERDSIGALTFNWGGGVNRSDAVWLDSMLRWMKHPSNPETRSGPGHQFAFMHHDPRAGIPRKDRQQESNWGRYDNPDTYLNFLTFGYLGLQYSPNNPIFIPIVTSLGNFVPNMIFQGDAFDHEWMGSQFLFDTDNAGAEFVCAAVNENLANPREGKPGLSHIFFGHNNIPAVSRWVREDQGGAVFPPPRYGQWTGSIYGSQTVLAPLVKLRSQEPPEWGRKMKFTDGRNAAVVRLDDVGESGSPHHGFSLVTVYPAERDPQPDGSTTVKPGKVTIEWVPIPK